GERPAQAAGSEQFASQEQAPDLDPAPPLTTGVSDAGAAAPQPVATDALTLLVQSATTFSQNFQQVYEALSAFRDAARLAGGRQTIEAATAAASHVAENPDALAGLIALGQQANAIVALLEAAKPLLDTVDTQG